MHSAIRINWMSAPVLFAAVSLVQFLSADVSASISLTTINSLYSESFDTLAIAGTTNADLTTLTGWELTESGGGARDNEQYAADTGGSNTGDTYSYGAGGNSERALGGLRSGTLISIFGAEFINNTGTAITSLAISYVGEQWRLGTAGRADTIDFQYGLTATSLTSLGYVDENALDFSSPVTTTVGAKDGNAAANRTSISFTIPSLSIANGASFWIRWTDLDVSGADDGLAVDEFNLTPRGVAPTAGVPEASTFLTWTVICSTVMFSVRRCREVI